MTRRPYQEAALAAFIKDPARVWALLWERQSGKSTTLADFALYEMLRHPGRTVIYASASLLLAQEITLKTAVRANQSVQQLVENEAARLKQFADHAQSLLEKSPLAPIGGSNERSECRFVCCSDVGQGEGAAPAATVSACLNQYSATFKPPIPDPQAQPFDNLNAGLWPATSGDTSALSPFLSPQSKLEFKTFDSQNDREINKYDLADFTNLFRQQRLEFRVYHSPTCYSRTKVIAPNIATARSWSGTVLLDEVSFIRNLRELMNALLPVITADKSFKLILSTTPPEFDDTHYSFELLAPPAGLEFKPNPNGNWYTSDSKIRVHRADAFDTYSAGKKIFDLKSGNEITPPEAFERAPNKDGHRIAHWLKWMLGGSAACDLLRLRTAQERGIKQCQNFQINSDADMTPALNWLHQNLGGRGGDSHAWPPSSPKSPPPPRHATPYEMYQWNRRPCRDPAYEELYRAAAAQAIAEAKAQSQAAASHSGSSPVTHHSSLRLGLGFDVATSTKGKANPSVVSILEEHGPEWIVRCRFIWKTKDPEIANQRIISILNVLERRGVRPRALVQDATNERYYAEEVRKQFRAKVPVVLVVASESVDKPSLDKPTNWKEYLGNQLIARLDDNNLTLPSDEYTRVDYRLVMKDRGRIVCEPNDQGMHGDCFDTDKLAAHALTATSSRRTIVPPRELWPQPPPPPKATLG
jgi:hypothetical protein